MSRCVIMLSVVAAMSGCGPEAEEQPSGVLASCQYINGFTGELECKEYVGSSWSAGAMRTDCDAPVPGSEPGELVSVEACDRSELQGVCAVDPGTVEARNIVFSSETGSTCDELSLGCFFARGDWQPSDPCAELE